MYQGCVLYAFRIVLCPIMNSYQLAEFDQVLETVINIFCYSVFKPNFGEQY